MGCSAQKTEKRRDVHADMARIIDFLVLLVAVSIDTVQYAKTKIESTVGRWRANSRRGRCRDEDASLRSTFYADHNLGYSIDYYFLRRSRTESSSE